jgi:acetyl esterase
VIVSVTVQVSALATQAEMTVRLTACRGASLGRLLPPRPSGRWIDARGCGAAPEYRIESIQHTPPERRIEDGKSAIRWLRMNAPHLGIDMRRVIAGGGSSGARIAAFAPYNTDFEPEDEDRSISPEPNALVLLNPAFGCPPGQSSRDTPCAVTASWKVTKAGPSTILFYGTEDPLQEGGRDFSRKLIAAGTRTEFYTPRGQVHGFFNRFQTRHGRLSCSDRLMFIWLRSAI